MIVAPHAAAPVRPVLTAQGIAPVRIASGAADRPTRLIVAAALAVLPGGALGGGPGTEDGDAPGRAGAVVARIRLAVPAAASAAGCRTAGADVDRALDAKVLSGRRDAAAAVVALRGPI